MEPRLFLDCEVQKDTFRQTLNTLPHYSPSLMKFRLSLITSSFEIFPPRHCPLTRYPPPPLNSHAAKPWISPLFAIVGRSVSPRNAIEEFFFPLEDLFRIAKHLSPPFLLCFIVRHLSIGSSFLQVFFPAFGALF